jgi:cold shock CspA family protein/ribosome-associated translation inhibitor RaiA
MKLPLQISFRRMRPSEELEKIVQEKAVGLETFSEHITSCRVVIEPSARRHRKGNHYQVRINVTLPGAELVATREPSEHDEYEDILVSVRDAFSTARRLLEDYVRRQRGDTKTHESVPRGRVSKLFSEKGFGFITAPDGHELYFHRNSVPDNYFPNLSVGDLVVFVEEEGQKGPQASTVKLAGGPFKRGA